VRARNESWKFLAVRIDEIVFRDVGGHVLAPFQNYRGNRRRPVVQPELRQQVLGVAGSDARPAFGGCQQTPVACGAFFPVDRIGCGLRRRHFVDRVHRQRLVFVPEGKVFVDTPRIGRPGANILPALCVEFDVPPPFYWVHQAMVEPVVKLGDQRALCRTFLASQRNALSANRPSRFKGQVFMQRPHMPPPWLMTR